MRIFIIGFMYSGKSTVGKKLANLMNLNHIDTDKVFESKYNITISSFFEKYGEDLFRELEHKILLETIEEDNIIVSTGALPFTPAIPGIDGDNVVNIVEAHRNESLIKGNEIVVCGGGASGLDGAIEMAEEMHKDVTVVEMLPEMGKDVFFINKISLFNKLAQNHVQLMTNTKVVVIDETGLTVEESGVEKHLEADTIISAFWMRPNTKLADQLKEKYPMKSRVIGDCYKLGKIGEAVREGFFAASSLD